MGSSVFVRLKSSSLSVLVLCMVVQLIDRFVVLAGRPPPRFSGDLTVREP
jgi:hypothetical protein